MAERDLLDVPKRDASVEAVVRRLTLDVSIFGETVAAEIRGGDAVAVLDEG